MNQGRTHRPQ
jgi:hypothetical protein